MARPDRQKTDSLIAELREKPFDFDFFAAVRLLQTGFANQPRIGHSGSASQDPVRFAQSPALDFAPATLESLQAKDPARPPRLYSRHFGLFGPNGPLPLCLTEYARDRVLHHGDTTFVAFCNVFHHRLLSFFFRAWADAQKNVDFDRPQDQHWVHYVRSLIGLGMDSLAKRDSVPDQAKLYFAGRLVHQNRNAEGLRCILEDFFGVPTEICTFVGKWLNLPANSICRLGRSRETGALGVTLLVGSRYWTCQLHFRVRLGPMKLADYERMLPSGGAYRRLCDWVRYYVGEHLSWDAQIILDKDEVPKPQLGKTGKLGWTTWLKTKPFQAHAEDLVLVPAN
jgi:type VI secretion system protein ImpH